MLWWIKISNEKYVWQTKICGEQVFVMKKKNYFKKTEIVTKLNNSNSDKPPKLKLWQHSKTHNVTKFKAQIVTKLKKSNCDKT